MHMSTPWRIVGITATFELPADATPCGVLACIGWEKVEIKYGNTETSTVAPKIGYFSDEIDEISPCFHLSNGNLHGIRFH